MRLCALLSVVWVLAACAPSESKQPADLVLRGGKVITVDQALGEQEAIAIIGHEITAVGSNDEIEGFIGADTEVIDLQGATVIPGLIEGHGHYLGLGRSKQILDLSSAESFADIVTQVGVAVDRAEPGEWIYGRGWHQEKWLEVVEPSVEGVPTHHSLSAISPDNPVLLGHASGHAAFANGRALAIAGIDANTQDPPGGTIVKDRDGEPTGLLRETAQRLVQAHAARAQAAMGDEAYRAMLLEQVQLAGEEALRYGVTSFHDAGADFRTIDFLRAQEEIHGLPIRLYVMLRVPAQEMQGRLGDYLMPLEGNDFLTVRSIKKQIDGALGAHGAWLLEPYVDLPETAGLVLETVEEVTRTAELAVAAGFQVNTHAIGTRANREVLDIYEAVWQAAKVDGKELRWRMEHAQHIHVDDIPRFAELGVIASVQGVHCTSDGPWISTRLGAARTESTSYRWRDLLDSGAIINNGTDAPVESLNPFASLYSSVYRVMSDGQAFFPEQGMTREEALYSYTMGNAIAAFEEARKGSITPGKFADLAVLDRDILTVPAEQMADTQVLYTLVGGEVRYQAP